jgi:tetratricopeptide (TPR) repeat protein
LAQPALETTADRWNAFQRNAIRTLVSSVQYLAEIELESDDPNCTRTYREALDLATLIGDKASQEICYFGLGRAYSDVISLRDLDEAERWYQKSLDLVAPHDTSGRGKTLGQLGYVAFQRYLDALKADRPIEEFAGHLAKAAQLYEQALDLMAETDAISRGTAHNQLGRVFTMIDNDRALRHYQEAIRYAERAGDSFNAGRRRHNVAQLLRAADRPDDALAYANAALANLQPFGERAAEHIQSTEELIADIKTAQAGQRGET